MKKAALIIKELSILKMPGFAAGMESLKSLAKNINVIAGPNASGKSSTARMIQNVIWKQNIERIHVETKLLVDNDAWSIKIDNGHYSSQRNGVDDTLPSIPAYDESKRYFLALHELISGDDKNLAAEILKESIGGYDLQKAQQTLGYRDNTPNLGLGEYKSFENNRKKVEDIEVSQLKLLNEEKKLTTLKEKAEQAKKASKLKQLYEYLIDFLTAEKEVENLGIEKSSYPEQMPLLIGNEYEVLSKLEKKIEDANYDIARIDREKESKTTELSALEIPEGGFGKVVLDELSINVDKLEDLERNLKRSRIDIRKREEETKVTLSRLFSTLKAEDVEALDLENIYDLDDFFEKSARLLNKKQTIEREIEELEKKKQKQDHTEENLHIAIRQLLDWFEKDATPTSSSQRSLWVLLILGGLTVPLTYFLGWMGLIGVLAMVIYITFISSKKKSSNDDALRETRITDFKKTGLREPASWQEEEVSKRLEELHQELHELKLQTEINRKLLELNNKLEQIQPDLQTLEVERQAWINKLSEIPELTVQNIEFYSGLFWFLKNLQRWQKYNNELQAIRLSFEEENEVYSETLTHINSMLFKVQAPSASDAASAKAILSNMKEDENKRSALLRDIKNLEERKVDYEALNAKDKEEITSLYSRLDLEVGAKEKLRELLNKKESYDNFIKEFEQAKRRRIEKQNELQKYPLYADMKDELPTQIEEAEAHKEGFEKQASEIEKLLTEIAEISTLISNKKTGRELEVALTEKESALDDLEQHYTHTMASITGDLIVNGLKKKTQEHSSSKVFNRANELFVKITHGHYELILDDSEGGSFRAKDTVLNLGQPLYHLSSGTRIQLLIAVRLAFIESQESGIKLPILADEVLANSDDLRAKQIIEALVEISKEGRQVFYFTAQTDELKKWQEHLRDHPEIDGEIFVLKGQANEQIEYIASEQTEKPSLSSNVLTPESYSNEEYHKQLNPPQYNLLSQTPAQLYLSYLIEDNQLLYGCLQKGIQYYGQLKSFVKHQGEIEGLTDTDLEVIDRKVELLDFYQELYQQGRPKPIDRGVLQDSGSVSDTFIDAVDAKLKELRNNPAQLIDALRAGEVSRFNRTKIEELENYLFEHNYLNENERLSPEDLRLQLQAKLSKMELTTYEADRFLERVVG